MITIQNIIPAHIFTLVINILTGVGISLSVIYIMHAGIQYIVSMGDQEKTKKARRALVNSIIGLIIVLSSITLVYVIGNTLGVDVSFDQLRSIVPF